MIHNETAPKVSVCVITYNQVKHIGQCLQSLVEQRASFAFEIIVGDDCSTDGTREVVQQYADRHPGVVRTISQEKNTGGTKNYLDVHAAATGEYIAHMDGDDFALPDKLQKQADFLDRHGDCSFVCHPVWMVSEDGSHVLSTNPEARQPMFSDIERLVAHYIFFSHSSKMYRRAANIFDHSQMPTIIDFFFHVEHASVGLIGFIPDVLACQRVTTTGITSATGDRLRRLFDLTLEGFARALQLGVREEAVNYGKSRYLVGAAVLCLCRGDLYGYRKYMMASRIEGRYFSVAHRALYLLSSCGLQPPVALFSLVRRWRRWRRRANPAVSAFCR